jgi:hypothetical protein
MQRASTPAKVTEGNDLDVLAVVEPPSKFGFLVRCHLAAAPNDEDSVRVLDSAQMLLGVGDMLRDQPRKSMTWPIAWVKGALKSSA